MNPPGTKKWLKPLIITVLTIAFLVLTWRFLFFMHKSADNLPHLENLDVRKLDELIGYQPGTLRNIWGDPNHSEDGQIIYQLDEDQYLVLTILLDHVIQAEIMIE